jgi:hypothetical protein
MNQTTKGLVAIVLLATACARAPELPTKQVIAQQSQQKQIIAHPSAQRELLTTELKPTSPASDWPSGSTTYNDRTVYFDIWRECGKLNIDIMGYGKDVPFEYSSIPSEDYDPIAAQLQAQFGHNTRISFHH